MPLVTGFVKQAFLVSAEFLVPLVYKVQQVLPDLLERVVRRDRLELLVWRDLLDHQECQDLQDLKVCLGLLFLMSLSALHCMMLVCLCV